MSEILKKDRERLRNLARKQLTFAKCERNDAILKQWDALATRQKKCPTVRLLFSNFLDEVVYNRLECEGEFARRIEAKMFETLVGRELFDDDTPIPDFFPLLLKSTINPFGIVAKRVGQKSGEKSIGYHIENVVEDLEQDYEKLKGGSFVVDGKGATEEEDILNDLFGDILPVRITMNSLTGAQTNPLVHLMGMENYYMSMYDCPNILHKVMDMATEVYERYYDFLETESLLLPTNGFAGLAQESYCFTDELPSDNVTKTTECWGFLESQETTAVAPDTFGEFAFPYQDRLAKRFGLLSYGCCERVDAIFEEYISRWKNLRKLSVSPFNNEEQIGEYLRGSDIIYYSKPRAEFVTLDGAMDEQATRENFTAVCKAARGCLFEVAQREVGTIHGDYNRGKRYVEILRECIETHWQP